MTEYWLQKKTIGQWSIHSRYDDIDQARNGMKLYAVTNNGYSWRIVDTKVVEEKLLEDHQEPKALEWGGPVGGDMATASQPAPPIASDGWGQPAPAFSIPSASAATHGNVGKVWMVHYGLKDKKRVNADQVEAMVKDGWVRGGPRTEFK